jgi:hypothetical protein
MKFKKRPSRDISDILNEKLITDHLELRCKNYLWNETQLSIIINTITDAINVIANFYSYYPGSAVYLFKMIEENNKAQGSDPVLEKRAIDYGTAMGDRNQLWDISNTFYFLLRMSTRTINEIFVLQLPPLQQEDKPISKDQLQEIHEILDYFLENAINALTNSPYYQHAKKEKHLYYHEPPIIMNGERLNPPPSEEKKRKRQPTELPELRLQQSAGTTFFNTRKKIKKSDSHPTELIKNTKHSISQQK